MSEIRATTISDAAGTGPITLTAQSAAKAFARTTGTYTGLIGDSLNASSISDDGTGNATISFTNSFSSSNYSPFGTVLATSGKILTCGSQATGSANFRSHDDDGSDSDNNFTSCIFGDLA